MAISLYDISVSTYLQVLGGLAGVLEKGAEYAGKNDLDLVEIVQTKLRPDMLPFRFQVVATVHQSLGAIKGIREGLFTPPRLCRTLTTRACRVWSVTLLQN